MLGSVKHQIKNIKNSNIAKVSYNCYRSAVPRQNNKKMGIKPSTSMNEIPPFQKQIRLNKKYDMHTKQSQIFGGLQKHGTSLVKGS